MSERPPWGPGDVIEWMGAPAVVLTSPRQETKHGMAGIWYARCAYLREHNYNMTYKVGQIVDHFDVTAKIAWSEPLTDAEEALAMQLLLTGESVL
jgi:hypothetical protein